MLSELEALHEKELHDEQVYLKLSEESPSEYSCIFKDLADEEASHARIINSMINDYKSHYPGLESDETNIDEDSDDTVNVVDENPTITE
jgi:rubrerythrin